MPGPANAFNTIFPYTLDKEDIDYLQKGVQSIFQEMCGINNNSWGNQYRSVPIPPCDPTSELDRALVEHNYHIESENYKPNPRCCFRSANVCNGNDIFPASMPCDVSQTVFNDIIRKGIDNEDSVFLKKSFYLLLWDVRESHWIRQLKWIDHPTTSDSCVNSQAEFIEASGCFPLNKSGCARTEGYSKRIYKFPKMQGKIKHREFEQSKDDNSLPYSKTYKGNKQALSREARNDQRRLSTAYQAITHSNLLNLNELKFRKKKLRLGKSEIHGLGLFASEHIGPNEIIIEYVGQIIRPIIADLRENGYKKSGLGYYCFLIDDGTVVDATKHGNINRYINHSCNPNSYAKILIINNQKKIVIYSKRHIMIDEEITYDYKMKIEDEKIECFCKAPGCRKSLN